MRLAVAVPLPGGELGQQRAATVGAGAVEQRLRPGHVAHQHRAQTPAKRGGERQLVAVAHAQLLAQRSCRTSRWVGRHIATADGCVAAQELVRNRELATHPRGLAAPVLRLALGRLQAHPGLLRVLVCLRARRACLLELRLQLHDPCYLALAGCLEALDLALDLALARGLDLRELVLQSRDSLLARAPPGHGRLRALGPVRHIRNRLPLGALRLAQRAQLELDALDPSLQGLCARAGLLLTQPEPLARGARLVHASGQRVMALRTLGQRALGLSTPGDDRL